MENNPDDYQLCKLKFKYRNPVNVSVVKNGAYKSRNNPAKGVVSTQGNGIRRRSYYTHIHA